MEEQPSEEFVSVSRTNHGLLLVDLLVSSPQRVIGPVTDFNGAVMNNELEDELFRDGTTREVEFDKGWSSTEDEAPAPLFSSEEGRVIRSVMGVVPSVHSFNDVSMVDKAVCANGLRSRDGITDPENDIIWKNLLFPTMEDMKVWLQEYSVRHHRPFIVQHSDVNKRYTVRCERRCGWKVWGRKRRDNQWKIANVKQPHTCGTAQVFGEHLQATANFIARRIMTVVSVDPDVSVATLIEVICGFIKYRVKYGKAWRAKQRAMQLLWGDWKEAYSLLPRILTAMQAKNSGMVFYPWHGNCMELDGGVMKHVLGRVYWSFEQCIDAFKHCRPILFVDATFLTGKYYGALMLAVGIDAEDQLIPLAFALTEGENNAWFLDIVRLRLVGLGRQVCIVSDRHCGILNAVKSRLDGHPDVLHRWCMRHLAANFFKQCSREDLTKNFKLLCGCLEKREFKVKLTELRGLTNERGKSWLDEVLQQKEKWAQAYDKDDCWYGMMTMNISKVFNNIIKGIRVMLVSAILEYSFRKTNSYFVDRWTRARDAFNAGERWGAAAAKHLAIAEAESCNQEAEEYDPIKHIYAARAAGGTSIGGERYGGRNHRVNITEGDCTCMVPMLLHVPCSHIITACCMRSVSHLTFVASEFSKQATMRTWEKRFEPYLDPSHWPPYVGEEYILDVTMTNKRRSRRKRKRLRNDMDLSQQGGKDMYSLGDFNDAGSTNRCSECHEHRHTRAKHVSRDSQPRRVRRRRSRVAPPA